MNSIQEAEKLLAGMTRAEKVQLLQLVVRDPGSAWAYVRSPLDAIDQEICENEAE